MAIECKWSQDAFEPTGMLAFRRSYPHGDNVLVAADVKGVSRRRIGGLDVRVTGLAHVAELVSWRWWRNLKSLSDQRLRKRPIGTDIYSYLLPGASMTTVQISARIDARLKKALDDLCRSRGIVMNHFIQEALLDRLEELEDVEDLKAIRHEPTRPLAEVLADLRLDCAP